MKTLKAMFCAMLVLCGSLFFAACGENKDFDLSKISINSNTEFVYNGNAQAVRVGYNGVPVNVTYALAENKDHFMPLSQLPTKDVGEYELYYRLSAKGYNDYTSAGTIIITVKPRPVIVDLADATIMVSQNESDFAVGYATNVDIASEDLGLQFVYGDGFDFDNLVVGTEFDLTCVATNPNYIVTANTSKLFVKDYVSRCDAQGQVLEYYSNLNDAFSEVQSGETLLLNGNVVTNNTIEVNTSVVIDGDEKFSIIAGGGFDYGTFDSKKVASLFNVSKSGVELTLKDVVLNGSNIVRGVSAFGGKVVVDGATISNGKKTDKWRSGGVYITHAASFEMLDGRIANNDANDVQYTKYCADLWIGANAIGSMVSVNGGFIGNAFVNSNSYSANGAGKFVLDGGRVRNVYVEYDEGYGANFEFKSGTVDNLFIALNNQKTGVCGASYKIQAVQNTTYVGGKFDYNYSDDVLINGLSKYIVYSGVEYTSNIDSLLADGNIYVFDNCTFKAPVNTDKNVTLMFNNCTFENTTEASLRVTAVSDLMVNGCEFNGVGHAVDVDLFNTTCNNVTIANNVINNTNDGVAVSVKTRKASSQNVVSGRIDGQVLVAGNDFADQNSYWIYIGDEPQGMNTTANYDSGNFDVLVTRNLDALSVYNRFKDAKNTPEHEKSILELIAGEEYDSTK